MKRILFISLIIISVLNAYEVEEPSYQFSGEIVIEKSMIQAFDSIIDMYIVGSFEQKSEFINSLSYYDFEAFVEYLRTRYPDEHENIP